MIKLLKALWNLPRTLRDLNDKITELENANARLRDICRTIEGKIEESEEDLLDSLAVHGDPIVDVVEDLDAKFAKLEKTVETLVEDDETKDDQIEALAESVEALKSDCKDLAVDSRDMDEALEALKGKVAVVMDRP